MKEARQVSIKKVTFEQIWEKTKASHMDIQEKSIPGPDPEAGAHEAPLRDSKEACVGGRWGWVRYEVRDEAEGEEHGGRSWEGRGKVRAWRVCSLHPVR